MSVSDDDKQFSDEEVEAAIHRPDPSRGTDERPERAMVNLACPKCKEQTPHRTKGREPKNGESWQWTECTICGTSTGAPTADYQANIDTPDNTDFGDA